MVIIDVRDIKDDYFISTRQAANYLGLTTCTLRRIGARLPRYRIGSVWRYKKSELDSFLSTHHKEVNHEN